MCINKAATGRNVLYNSVDELPDVLSEKNVKRFMMEFDKKCSSNQTKNFGWTT